MAGRHSYQHELPGLPVARQACKHRSGIFRAGLCHPIQPAARETRAPRRRFYVLGHADERAVEAAEREAAAQREGLVRRGSGAEFVVIERLLLGLQLAPECCLRRGERLIAPYALILLREHS